MNVLVVDDDRTTRFLLSRALTKRFGCAVTEAGDGDQALDALARGSYDLAILDVQMPVVDGLQALRILRQSPGYLSLPVVMLTGERDEAIVREILELGVLEYLTKPLNMARLSDRIRRILRCVGPERAPTIGASAIRKALADRSRPVLIVEGRASFRTLFAEALRPRRPVVEAETGVQGLRACIEHDPAVVFVGTDLGVLSEPLLAKKIRATPSLRHLPLVAIVDDDEEADGRTLAYDETILRAASGEALLGQLADLSRRGTDGVLQVLGLHSRFRATLLLVGEQVFGTTLAADVVLRDPPAPSQVERIRLTARGTVAEGGDLSLQMACDIGTARRAAVNLFGIDARIVREEDAEVATGRVFELVTTRLQTMLADSGQAIAFAAPTRLRSAEAFPGASALDAGFVYYFRPAKGEQEFWLTVEPPADEP